MIKKINFLKNIFFVILLNPLGSFAQDTIPQIWTLDACINYAIENNFEVKQYLLRQDKADIGLSNSKNLYLPSVEGRLRNIHNWGLFVDPATNILTTKNSEIYTGSVEAEWDLFNGGMNYYAIKQSRELYNVSRADQQAKSNEVSFMVMTSYFQVMLYAEQLNIANAQKKQTEKQYLQIRGMVERGVLHKRELLQMESELAFREVAIIDAFNSMQKSSLQLRQTMGLTGNAEIRIDTSRIYNISDDLNLIHYDTLCKNAQFFLPEISSEKSRLNARRYALRMAEARRYPSLSLTAGLLTKSSSLIQVEQSSQFNQNLSEYITFNLRVPIFNRFSYNNNISSSRIDILIQENEVMKVNQEVEQRIQAAWLDMSASYKKYQALKKQVNALQAQYVYSEKSYAAGITNYIDFSYVTNLYNNTQLKLLQSKYDYFLKRKVLDFYEGKGFCEAN